MKKAVLLLAITIATLFISVNSYAQEPDPPVITNSIGGNLYVNYLQMITPVSEYQVTASNLIDDLIITAITNASYYGQCQIEISLSPDDGFTSQLILSPVEGLINTTIYVRPGCETPLDIRGTITHTSSNAISDVISVTISNEYHYQYAPIVEIGNIEAMPDTQVNVPITAINFNGIGVIGYYIDFDPTVLTFTGIQNVYQSLPHCIFLNCPNQYPQESCSVTEFCESEFYEYILANLIEINSSRSRLYIKIRQELEQFSVPDNEKLFDIVFNYSGGISNLEFAAQSYYYYSGNGCGGFWCEPEIINEPLNNYYINGSVGPAPTPVISNSTNGFIEQYFVYPQNPPPASYHLTAGNLTEDLLISASMLAAYPEGCTIGFSLNPESGFLPQLAISPVEGVVDATVYFKILYNEGISEWEGWIVHSSAGAADDMIFADLSSDYWTIDAPVASLGHILGQPGTDIIVPLNVINLEETGVGEFYIDFDPHVLTFNGIGNLHPVFANHFPIFNNCSDPSVCTSDPAQAYIISDEIPVNESLSRVFIRWNEEINTGGWLQIPDGTLLDLYFSYLGGTSQLTFTDGDYNYSGNGTPMDPIIINEPFENFYINGSVGPVPTPVISNSTNGFIEQYFVNPQNPPPGSYHLSANNLTDDLLISASVLAAYPESCTIGFSLNPENGFSPQLNISPVEGLVDATVYFKILYNEGISEWEGWIVHSSAGAADDMIFADLASDYWTIDAPVATLGNIYAQPGSDVIVPLIVHNLQETGVGEYYIDFDPNVLTFNGIGNLHPVFANHFALYNNCSDPSVCTSDPAQAYIISDEIPVNESLSRVFIRWNEEINTGGWLQIPDGTLLDLYFSYLGGTSQLTFTDGSYNYSGNGTPMDPIIINEPFENFYINGSVGPLPKTVNLELNLEGLYNTAEGMMNQAQGRQFAVEIADEIIVGLALSSSPYTIVFETEQVLLNRNGLCTFEIPGNFNANYYVVIKHRNSVETWSAIPVNFNGIGTSYNFTASAGSVFGNNLKLSGTKYCIYTGDINQDGIIDIYDMTLLDNDVATFSQGYIVTDLNGDGNADTGDMTIVDNNASGFVGTIKPGNN